MGEKSQFSKGDSVKICGQSCVGEIVGVSDRHATVAFEAMEVSVALGQLEKVQLVAAVDAPTYPTQPTQHLLGLGAEAFSSFNPEIDLHGMSVDDALNTLDRWILFVLCGNF